MVAPSLVVKRRRRPPHVAALPEPAYFLPQPEEGRAGQLVSRGDRWDRRAHTLVNRDEERPFFAFMDSDDVGGGRECDHLADILLRDLDPKAWRVLRLGVVLLGGLHLHEEERRAGAGVNQLDQEVERLLLLTQKVRPEVGQVGGSPPDPVEPHRGNRLPSTPDIVGFSHRHPCPLSPCCRFYGTGGWRAARCRRVLPMRRKPGF